MIPTPEHQSGDVAWAAHQQAIAADPAHSAFATANAGSGKTKVLIDRVARLLLRRPDGRPGAAPDSILCITYTRAAANEMLSRLFKRLGAWAVMEDAPLRVALSELEGMQAESYSSDQLKSARALFARALETPGGLRIETIHAFCARVLRRFPLEAGIVPGFVELEEAEAEKLWRQAKAEAVFEASRIAPRSLELLARERGGNGAFDALDAVRQSRGAFRAFAEDNACDRDRMIEALRREIAPPESTVLALIEDAVGAQLPVGEIQRCIATLQEGGANDRRMGDLLELVISSAPADHRFAAYLDVFLTNEGLVRSKPLYTRGPAQQEPLLSGLFAMGPEEGRETQRMLAVIAETKRARAFERMSALVEIGWPALQAFDRLKARRGSLDFDDLISKTRSLIEAEGLSSWVLFKLDGGINHVLLDEAQDTSPDQWRLIRSLTQEFTAGSGRERSQEPRTVFFVGDEKQSIYSFQGADPASFLKETRALLRRASDCRHANMQMSFRSTPEILRFVDRVWNLSPIGGSDSFDQPPLAADLIEHHAWRSHQAGLVELWPIVAKDPELEADPWTRPVDVLRQTSPKIRLADAIALEVKRILDDGVHVWADAHTSRPANPGDILILVRERRGGLFEALINALKERAIPVAGADRLQLTDYIGVQDCLNLMRFALLPTRDLTLAETLRGPFCNLVDDDHYLFALAAGRRSGESLWSRVERSDDPAVQTARDFLKSLIANAHLPPFEFLTTILETATGDGSTGWEKVNARLGTPARDPIEALLSQALAFDAAGPASLQLFVASMEADRIEVKRDLAEAGHAVRIMTVHGAKGLEAPIVILPDTSSRPKLSVPDVLGTGSAIVWTPRRDSETEASKEARKIAEIGALQEHRRLLYVALTRAKDRLLIAGHWFGGSGENNDGFHIDSWYASCLRAMQSLGATSDASGILRIGKPITPGAEQMVRNTGVVSLPDWVGRPPVVRVRTARFVASSTLSSKNERVLAPLRSDRSRGMRRGELIHFLLQVLPEIELNEQSTRAKEFLRQQTDLTDQQRLEIANAVLLLLRDPSFAEFFKSKGRAEVPVVGTSHKLPAGTVINGRIDRLVETPDEILILDFKTDRCPPGTLAAVDSRYLLQMAAYSAVLENVYPDRRITAALCWTEGPQIMRLDPVDLQDALNSLFSRV